MGGSDLARASRLKRPAPFWAVLVLALWALSVRAAPAPEALGDTLAREAAPKLAALKRPLIVCAYVDAGALSGGAPAAVARALSSSLGGQLGVAEVREAGLSSAADAPARAAAAGCEVAVTVTLSKEGANLSARGVVFFARREARPRAASLSPRLAGKPFTASAPLPEERPPEVSPPAESPTTWRMQQITLDGASILALGVGDLDADGGAELAVLEQRALAVYRFEPKARATTLLAAPKELARADLSKRDRAERVSRDPVGALAFAEGEPAAIAARTSELKRSAAFRLTSGGLVSVAEVEGWPVASLKGEVLWGEASLGKNYFTGPVKLGGREIDLGVDYTALSAHPSPDGPTLAAVGLDRKLRLYTGLANPPLLHSAEVGDQILLADLDLDGVAELIATSPSAAGEGDELTIFVRDERGLKRLWRSGTLYAPAGPNGARPLAAVTALAAGDIDRDGRPEVIAALSATTGTTILVISR